MKTCHGNGNVWKLESSPPRPHSLFPLAPSSYSGNAPTWPFDMGSRPTHSPVASTPWCREWKYLCAGDLGNRIWVCMLRAELSSLALQRVNWQPACRTASKVDPWFSAPWSVCY